MDVQGRNRGVWAVGLIASLLVMARAASAATVPFTETFTSNASNWFDGPGTNPVGWVSSGGPDGSAFVSTTGSFMGRAANDPVLLFRGQDELNSSGGAFVGNWVTSGVTGFNAAVRHDAGVALNFFVRFAGPANFPGANNVFFIPVPSGTWTDLSAALPNPNLIFEGPLTYNQVFGNVGHVQVGVSVPGTLAGSDANFTFDLDNVSIVPEPTTLGLLALGGLAAVRRRFRRRAA